ncbi:hypothetical protein G5714_014581 [Onychostoma macrolepis]|uniref:Kazal-like domain-containing protein n=1 Tax=Onychostoma macrolepis TaxID=369639 RepID=A0A7J6CDG1_9TELE|nr:hypothetical protein G5714_014581 [Onychostoma macrolepis]
MYARSVIILLCFLVAISDGASVPDCKYSQNICPMNFSPLCGTNGITYGNECMLCAAIKASNTKILIRNQGQC